MRCNLLQLIPVAMHKVHFGHVIVDSPYANFVVVVHPDPVDVGIQVAEAT